MVLKDNDFEQVMSYIVTAEEQREYFKVVLKAAELANPKLAGKTTNISTGTVKLTTGKMSSRTGNVVNISWLFDELSKAVKARGATGKTVELSSLAALRYAMLKNRLTSDTVLDVESSVSLEGNTGPYLQYAYARAQSLLGKATKNPEPATDLEDSERYLVRKLTEFNSVVDTAANELMPHHICGYLYELAQNFNSFYEHNRVVGEPREAVRVWLVGKYAETLKQGLTLLGISAPDHM
jgi:arginyl-tRNA synthetase